MARRGLLDEITPERPEGVQVAGMGRMLRGLFDMLARGPADDAGRGFRNAQGGQARPMRNAPQDMGRAVHFSHQPLDRVDPAQQGTNPFVPDANERRYFSDPRYPAQSYIGIDPGTPHGYRRELGVGPYMHDLPDVEVERLYDATEDALGIFNDRSLSVPERMARLKELGYPGLRRTDTKQGAMGTIFEPTPTGRLRAVDKVPGSETDPRTGRTTGYRAGPGTEGLPLMMKNTHTGTYGGYMAPEGKPETVKIPGIGEVEARPIGLLDRLAEEYNAAAGLGPHRVEAFPEFDEDRARRIAAAFDRMQHNPSDPRVRRAYDAMIEETLAQYRKLADAGVDIRFLRPDASGNIVDPYAASPSQGYADLVDNGRLYVFPTEGGFGSSDLDVSDNPLLKRVGRVGDLENATANDAFRAVHDLFGHFAPGNPFFRHKGEERAWLQHSRMYSPDARGAMTSETRGQNSWLNFGPYAEHNRTASGADTRYADQKIGLLPEEFWGDEGGQMRADWMRYVTPAAALAALAAMEEGE